jgi:hypothetical protein
VDAPKAYTHFDNRDKGGTNVVLRLDMANSGAKRNLSRQRGRGESKAASAKA